MQSILPQAATQFWTLDSGCFFNPAASAHNLVKDCETEMSHCRYDKLIGKCGWDLNTQFIECYKKRGLTVSYRHDKNSAAVQRASDCKYLQNK
ncbi:hypothetical protein, partial [Salmonella sp. s51944]|uniref:hypothetical protein n=1 Tax=Salmonella sp. s51944 TaxID=3159655 RepID=UPI00397F90C1